MPKYGPPRSVVPSADATTNTDARDVIGNKTDVAQTTVGTTRSIIAYVKGILNQIATLLGYHTVPTADVVDNAQVRDVVGNKTDVAVEVKGTTKSLMAYVKGLIDEGWRHSSKSLTFTGLTGFGLAGEDITIWTPTGLVHIKYLIQYCPTVLTVVAGAQLLLTFNGAGASLIALTTADDINAGLVWMDSTPSGFDLAALHEGGGFKDILVGNGQLITLGTRTQNTTGGVLEFHAFWKPVTSDGALA